MLRARRLSCADGRDDAMKSQEQRVVESVRRALREAPKRRVFRPSDFAGGSADGDSGSRGSDFYRSLGVRRTSHGLRTVGDEEEEKEKEAQKRVFDHFWSLLWEEAPRLPEFSRATDAMKSAVEELSEVFDAVEAPGSDVAGAVVRAVETRFQSDFRKTLTPGASDVPGLALFAYVLLFVSQDEHDDPGMTFHKDVEFGEGSLREAEGDDLLERAISEAETMPGFAAAYDAIHDAAEALGRFLYDATFERGLPGRETLLLLREAVMGKANPDGVRNVLDWTMAKSPEHSLLSYLVGFMPTEMVEG